MPLGGYRGADVD